MLSTPATVAGAYGPWSTLVSRDELGCRERREGPPGLADTPALGRQARPNRPVPRSTSNLGTPQAGARPEENRRRAAEAVVDLEQAVRSALPDDAACGREPRERRGL